LQRYLRENRPDAAQILMTGDMHAPHAEHMGELGLAFTKPLPFDDLYSALFDLIERSLAKK